MPKLIKTNSIVDPAIQQPFTGKSLAWLQQWGEDSTFYLVRSMLGDANYTAGAFAVQGVRNTGINPVVNISNGAILYDGEFFVCDGLSTTLTGSNVVIANVVETFDGTIDPITFTDGVPRSVHSVRKVVLTQGLTGTGMFDYSTMVFIQDVSPKNKRFAIGDWNMDLNAAPVSAIVHGLDFAKITNVTAMILSDTGALITELTTKLDGATAPGGGIYLTATNVVLERVTGGYYDQVGYDSTSFNRGYVNITYIT